MTPRTTRKPTPDPAERAAVVETIGVLDAIEWLDTQVKNRPLSNVTIRRYAAEMLEGLRMACAPGGRRGHAHNVRPQGQRRSV